MAYFEELFKEFREGKTLSFRNGRGRVKKKGKTLGLDIHACDNEMIIFMAAILVEDDWKVEEEKEEEIDLKKIVLEGLEEILDKFNRGNR